MSRKSLVPLNVLASSTAPTIPTLRAGDIYFNTVDGILYAYSGSSWISSGGGSTGGGESNSFEVLAEAPSSPSQGRVYFDSSENTIKVYNGNSWYDVGGPKSILEHEHGLDGLVNSVDYSNYVSDDKIFANAGASSSQFMDNYIDGGNASGN
jgi:hypothetical protein